MANFGGVSAKEKTQIKNVIHAILCDIRLNHETHYNAKSLARDTVMILSCIDARGLNFLTHTMPLLGAALDDALQSGVFMIPQQFKRRCDTALPRLLYALWSKVFDRTGALLECPCIDAIVDLRFLTKAFYKYELDYDEATIRNSIATFIDTDNSLPLALPKRGGLFAILDVARTLICEVLGEPPSFFIPGHSSGAVATGEKSWEKTNGLLRLPQYKILGGMWNFYCYPSETYYNNHVVDYSAISVPIAKLCGVPKDPRGPRLMCEEPVTQMFLQQGIKTELYERIETHHLTKGYVNFEDQTINQRLAIIGSSVEPGTVTLDMKEASDRISYALVERLFPPQWLALFDAVRTDLVELPSGNLLNLRKYAPMGSALCFPIESLVHWALSCATYMLQGYSSDTVLCSIYVYGDDIVLRGLPPASLFKIFPYLGLKFNEAKSCTKGRFRESCGVDAFNGRDVSILKFKKRIPISLDMPELHVAWVEYASMLYTKGYTTTAHVVRKWIDGIRIYPTVRPHSDCIGYTDTDDEGFDVKDIGLKPYPALASAICDRQPVYATWSIRPKRPKAELVSDRSRYFETLLILARRQSGLKTRLTDPTVVSYVKKHKLRFVQVWSTNVVA